MKEKRNFLISFHAKYSETSWAIGNQLVESLDYEVSYEDIKTFEKEMAKQVGAENVIVLHINPLRS